MFSSFAMGGPSVDADEPRRSIYAKVLRNRRDPLLDVFDAADPYMSTGRRNVTTTPTQSLLMINGGWVLKRAEAFAERLLSDESLDDAGRIDRAYRLAFGRPPASEESAGALEFLHAQSLRIGGESVAAAGACEPSAAEVPIDPGAWVDFCHALLNSNEFLYVD